MFELISIFVEALFALIMLICELLAAWGQVLLEGLAVLACFLFSRRFRERKLEVWRAQPRKKIIDLSLATGWLALVVGVPILVFAPSPPRSSRNEISVRPVSAQSNEGVRLELRFKNTKNTNAPGLAGTVVVKKGGVTKLLGTKSLGELKTQLVENVTVIKASASRAPHSTNP